MFFLIRESTCETTEFFSSVIVFFNSRISLLSFLPYFYLSFVVAISLSNFLFFSCIVFLVSFSFLCFLIVHWTSLRRLFRTFCLIVQNLHFSRVSYWSLISFLWWCPFTWFFVMLDSLHWFYPIWIMGLLFQTLQACFGRDLYQSAKFGFWVSLLVMFWACRVCYSIYF